ncbi:MAG: co-chaperone GroES, partial [Paludibacter sp.]|nr:co-chaperone GroES [Paludibacter sp.]
VFFTNDADYDINVLEKDLYRMCIRNIIGIERNGSLVCMTNKMLVQDVTENISRGGLIYRRNERERVGIVQMMGEEIKHISIGSRVSYFNGLASRLNYCGKEYSFLTLQEINYNTMNGHPYLNRVLIEQDEAQGQTLSGLIIPDNAKEKPYTGIIVNIGPDVTITSIGTKVMYHKNKGAEVVIDGKDYLLMMDRDLLYNL